MAAGKTFRFNSPFLFVKHARAYLNPGQASSIALTTGANPNWSVIAGYAAGLHGMMRNLALNLAPLRVNLIIPGAMLTPLWDGMEREKREGLMEVMRGRCTLGRLGRAEDVAEAYLYVMKDRNVAGSVVESNGGLFLTL